MAEVEAAHADERADWLRGVEELKAQLRAAEQVCVCVFVE